MSKMFEIERLDHILAFLHEKPTATVKTLANRLYASEATVRRDLTELEKRGLVKRLHGGVVLLDLALEPGIADCGARAAERRGQARNRGESGGSICATAR